MVWAGLPPRPADSGNTKWILNLPPGWPEPPAGWQPPPGWKPDPSWPPAPPGWYFWKPAPEPARKRISTFVKAAAGTITLIATITGTYLAYLAVRPDPATTATWVRQANSVCDQEIGAMSQSIFNGLAPSAAGPQGSSVQASQVSKVSALIGAVASLTKVIGEMDALPTPGDSRVPQVRDVLSSGHALVNSLNSFSYAAQDSVETTSPASIAKDYATEVTAYKKFQVNIVTWRKAIGRLGLNQCPFWTSGNPNVLPSPPQTIAPPATQPGQTAVLSYAEQQLANRLNASDLNRCYGQPGAESADIVAAVNCYTVTSGPTKQPLVVQFSDISAAQAWFSRNTTGYVDQNDCAGGHRLGTWTHNEVNAGMLGCTYTTSGGFRMVWVIDGGLVGVIADGSNGSTMYSWWLHSAYVLG
jgi:hypothetical protein